MVSDLKFAARTLRQAIRVARRAGMPLAPSATTPRSSAMAR